ncbi:putative ion transporter [Suhomyces tanzawaensis NRRL Y-17324]|uniref:Putative ion transporter n=1 Tax=Suhomyces tanzawaensis NRRL Y-17324 TaxID=984487 RepID=A0A1E4SK52_9ASCO|nr:putative ion transporter [Suhomyces tanzawaensis NRRL Y-17324]ODV79883.1 putative ion transporter [Suhomyces tanzawaensis NRRL Y-17324]
MTNIEKILSGQDIPLSHENVPGTIHLIDMAGNLKLKKEHGDIILQPQPSSNPNDPLRWSFRKKVLQFTLLWVWAFFLALSVGFTGPLWTEWVTVLNTNFKELGNTQALIFLGLGLGCLFLQPTALKLGRRFVYIGCTILVIGALILGSQSNSIKFMYPFQFLAGIAAAPVDSLVEISSTDVFFVHQRSTAISLLILALYAGNYVGPVVSGYVNDGIGWRWTFYIQIIIYGVLLVIQIFLMEDTTFRREHRLSDLEEEILRGIKSRDTVLAAVKSGELTQDDLEKNKHLRTVVSINESHSSSSDAASVDESIPLRTYWQRRKFMELEYNDQRSWFTIWYRPFLLANIPAFIWGGVLYGAQMMWLSLIAVTLSQVYSSEPYGWEANGVGLTNLSSFVGSVIGMFYGGYFVDWLVIKLARRNNGILEPEFRIWAMVVPTLINAAGILAYGLGASNGAKWPIPVVVGQGFLGFAMSSSGAICLAYAVDSYERVASEGLVLMLFTRNMIGMVFTFAFQPWLQRCGFNLTTWLLFMMSLVINGTFILMIIYGKRFRRWSAAWYDKVADPFYGEVFRTRE